MSWDDLISPATLAALLAGFFLLYKERQGRKQARNDAMREAYRAMFSAIMSTLHVFNRVKFDDEMRGHTNEGQGQKVGYLALENSIKECEDAIAGVRLLERGKWHRARLAEIAGMVVALQDEIINVFNNDTESSPEQAAARLRQAMDAFIDHLAAKDHFF